MPLRIPGSRRRNKGIVHDTQALSEVLGALMILAILLTTTTLYYSRQLPELTKEYESLHSATVTEDFEKLDSSIDGIVLAAKLQKTGTGTTPIKMAPNKVPIIGMTPPGSSLFFTPGGKESLMITPIAGNETLPYPENRSWVQNTTTGFNYTVDETKGVIITSRGVELADETVSYPNLTINGTSEIGPSDPHHYNVLKIINGGKLYVGDTGRLTIYATKIFVDSTSQIIGDQTGHSGGFHGENGEGDGGGFSSIDAEGSGGGAGHGGRGGNGSTGFLGGPAYNDNTSFSIELGSGGGGGNAFPFAGGRGGNGGGAIWLEADEINISGTITAKGGQGVYTQQAKNSGGGGSGGSILLYGRAIAISGTLSVQGGGSMGNSPGGGGAGGRIKIFNESLSDTIANYKLSGGVVSGRMGQDGTIHKGYKIYTASVPHVTSGSYISAVHNTTGDTTCYGNMTWNATLYGQTLVLKVRTDMFADMRGAPGWAYCPAITTNETDISELSSVADGHRYVQYCAELSTADTALTPVLHWVQINYTTSNPEYGGKPVLGVADGAINFQSSWIYYPNQELVYEHGAVLKIQETAGKQTGFVLRDPPILIGPDETTGAPVLHITLIDLTGSSQPYSGSKTTSIETYNIYYGIKCEPMYFPNLTLNFTTAYPDVWDKWFNTIIEKSKLNASYYDQPPPTNSSVEVVFRGGDDGVKLYLDKATIQVKVTT